MSSKANSSTVIPASVSDLRNVLLVGAPGSGKTTLFENLVRARVPSYRGDKDQAERTAALTLATINQGPTVINLLDAPGGPDFLGELRAGLRAADAAIFVASAAGSIDVATQLLWQECQAAGLPRAIVVTKLDLGKASFEQTLRLCKEQFGAGVHPAYLPYLGEADQIVGNLSLLSRKVHDYSSGSREWRAATQTELAAIEDFRTEYLESIITESDNEALLERYFGGDELQTDEVMEDLMKALYHGSFYPVIPVLTNGVGTEELIGVIDRGFPTPLRRQLPDLATAAGELIEVDGVSQDGPLLAQVIRTSTDQYAGRLSMVRIFCGTLNADQQVRVTGQREAFTGTQNPQHPDHADVERLGPISSLDGTELISRSSALAGEIVFVAKLAKAETGDTISDPDQPVAFEPWLLPEPLLPVALKATSRNDEDKLAAALQRLLVEDSAVRLERAHGTDQLLLWTSGPNHHDLLLNRLSGKYGVNFTSEPIKTALRETFIAPAVGHGRHVKQSGGHGQYAVCDIRVEPNERGAGFEFIDQVVGGAVPRQFIASVEKGIRAQLDAGVLTGHRMVDVKVTLYDGKAHSVDSSDMAFQAAGALAIKDAANTKNVALLEPLDEVAIEIAEEYLGTVLGDLSVRRAQVLGTDLPEPGKTIVRALVPQSELSRYAIDLRGLAHGTGKFSRNFHGYELLPEQLAAEIIKNS